MRSFDSPFFDFPKIELNLVEPPRTEVRQGYAASTRFRSILGKVERRENQNSSFLLKQCTDPPFYQPSSPPEVVDRRRSIPTERRAILQQVGKLTCEGISLTN